MRDLVVLLVPRFGTNEKKTGSAWQKWPVKHELIYKIGALPVCTNGSRYQKSHSELIHFRTEHAFGVDDADIDRYSSLARANRVLDAGHFSQAQTGHSSLAPRSLTLCAAFCDPICRDARLPLWLMNIHQ